MLIASGELELCYDGRIIPEYKEVLSRSRFGFKKEDIDALLHQIKVVGQVICAEPLKLSLPDIDDEPFLEIAIDSSAECLITGNVKHYAKKRCKGVKVLSPSDFVKKYYS